MSENISLPSSSDSDRNSDNNFEEITEDAGAGDFKKSQSIEEFDKNLPETITLLRAKNGTKVYLIGTAHFSIESQNDVSMVIQKVQPQVVMIELCPSRINILQLDEETLLEEAKNINIPKIMSIIKQSGAFNGVMYLLLLSMSAQLAKELGMAPGGEFRRAFFEASQLKNCSVRLGDRPIQITLQRALARLSWFQTVKLVWRLLVSSEPISKEDIEKCKRRDMLEELLAEMTGEFPALGEVFVTERDICLTNCLQVICQPHKDLNDRVHQCNTVVGVVGIGHVPGIINRWPEDQQQYISNLMTVPPPTLTSKLVKVTFKVSMVFLGGYMAYRYIPGTQSVIGSCRSALKNLVKMN